MVRRGSGLLGVLLLVACGPSLQSMSAGQIGCQESEIQISDEDFSFGASETWIATCENVRYVCSHVRTGEKTSQVNCAAEKDAEKTKAVAAGDTAAPSDEPAHHPDGAGGFRFGQQLDEAASTCSAASFEFTQAGPTSAHCGGLPSPLAFKASAELTLCREGVCGIALVGDPSLSGTSQVNGFIGVAAALAKKYGQPYERSSSLPAECKGEALQGCLDGGRIDLKQTWQWSESSISLTLSKPPNAGKSERRVFYAQPKRMKALKPDAL
jgi:hypothetical protein